MKKAILLLSFAFLSLLPGCLSESIKTSDTCEALESAQPPSGENWANSNPADYQNAWAYEKISCWHEAAIWYAIKGDVVNATDSCRKIYYVDWPAEDFRDDERNMCISDIAEKLGEVSLCDNIPDTMDNWQLRHRCITHAEKAAQQSQNPMCGGAFILAGLGAFLFARRPA